MEAPLQVTEGERQLPRRACRDHQPRTPERSCSAPPSPSCDPQPHPTTPEPTTPSSYRALSPCQPVAFPHMASHDDMAAHTRDDHPAPAPLRPAHHDAMDAPAKPSIRSWRSVP